MASYSSRTRARQRIANDPFLNPSGNGSPQSNLHQATHPPTGQHSAPATRATRQLSGTTRQATQQDGQPRHRTRAKNRRNSFRPKLHPMQQLEALDEELSNVHGNTGAMRWLVPYADLMTLLLGLFLMLMAFATQENNWLEGVTANLMTEVQVKTEQVEAQQHKLNEMKATMDALNVALADVLAPEESAAETLENGDMVLGGPETAQNPEFTVTQDERGLVITLLDSVLFTPGNATLSDSAKKALATVASKLKTLPNDVRIEGHTDNTPIQTALYPNNWYLSTARATSIVEYFVKAHQFSPKRLSAAGYGEYHPVASNSTIEGKQKNRRVDIIVLNVPDEKKTTPSSSEPSTFQREDFTGHHAAPAAPVTPTEGP